MKLKKITSKQKLSLVIVLVSIGLIFLYWLYTTFYPSTDDAYTNANQISVMPQITGEVNHIYVSNNQQVSAGQLLFSINEKPFILLANRAKLQLDTAENEIDNIKDQLQEAQYDLIAQQAIFDQKKQYYERASILFNEKYLSMTDMDNIETEKKVAEANVGKAKATIEQLRSQLNNYNLQIDIQKNNLKQANLDLEHTQIRAAFNGIVTDFNLRPGQVVSAAQQLFTLVDHNQFWVDANFKETQLSRIRIGQKAKIKIDMLGSKNIDGIVSSISSASGASLSVLPPENFSGNWVKITQRIPVKILINNINASRNLPVGASSEVTINTLP